MFPLWQSESSMQYSTARLFLDKFEFEFGLGD